MTQVKTRFIALVGLLATGQALVAAELPGKVIGASPGTAKVRIEGDALPNSGDTATLFFKLPGSEDEVAVGDGKVAAVAGDIATIKLNDSSITPVKDQLARITSSNPQKRSAAAASPTAAAASASAIPGSEESIAALLVGRWAGRSADGLQGTIVFKPDSTITIPLQHSRGAWISGKYSIDSSASPARVIITDIAIHPPPAAIGEDMEIHESRLKGLKESIPDAFARTTWIAEIIGPEQIRIEGFAGGADKRQSLSASAAILKKLASHQRELIADYISPTVVFVEVHGEVRKPGRVPWKEGMTVLDAINAAGGVTAAADVQGIELRDHRYERVYMRDHRTFLLNPIDYVVVPRLNKRTSRGAGQRSNLARIEVLFGVPLAGSRNDQPSTIFAGDVVGSERVTRHE